MSEESLAAKLVRLKREVKETEDQLNIERKQLYTDVIETITKGMCYNELCALREVLNERIRSQYAAEDDE